VIIVELKSFFLKTKLKKLKKLLRLPMQKTAALIAIATVILYGLYNALHKKQGQTHGSAPTQSVHPSTISPSNHTGQTDESAPTAYEYIVNVIRHGSQGLGFPGGIMEGGYIPDTDAPKVACYVLKLSGKRCPSGTESADAHLIFSSVCAGCHGNDGRGIHGTYPDLTRPTLLGIERKTTTMRSSQ
jgi:hypothetical protein